MYIPYMLRWWWTTEVCLGSTIHRIDARGMAIKNSRREINKAQVLGRDINTDKMEEKMFCRLKNK